jgi:hypothetical protein
MSIVTDHNSITQQPLLGTPLPADVHALLSSHLSLMSTTRLHITFFGSMSRRTKRDTCSTRHTCSTHDHATAQFGFKRAAHKLP